MNKLDPAKQSPAQTNLRSDNLLSVARLASQGQSEAISTLVLALGGTVLKTVRQVLGAQHPDVEDVAQEALLAIMSGLGKFREQSTVRHYAKSVALNTALSARRQLRVRARYTEAEAQHRQGEENVQGEARQRTPDLVAIANRRRELLRSLLDRLPLAISEALAMHFILGWTVQEIARDAGVSEHTVWSRLRLGKKALRRALSNDVRLGELCDWRPR